MQDFERIHLNFIATSLSISSFESSLPEKESDPDIDITESDNELA